MSVGVMTCHEARIVGRTIRLILGMLLLGLAGLMPARAATAGPVAGKPVTLEQLVEMRVIDSLVLSPDHSRIAFRVVARSLRHDDVSTQWYVARADGRTAPVRLGKPSPPLWEPMFDFVDQAQAQWDPSSRWLYVRMPSTSGKIGIHRLAIGGADAVVVQDPGDVMDFHLSPDGSRIVFRVGASRAEIVRAQDEEKRDGIRLDRTVITDGMRLTSNFQIGKRWTTIRRLDAGSVGEAFAGPGISRSVSIAHPKDAAVPAMARDDTAIDFSRGPLPSQTLSVGGGRRLSFRPVAGPESRGDANYQLTEESARETSVCEAIACRGASSAFRLVTFNRQRNEAVILFEMGSTHCTTIFGWNGATGATRTIYGGSSSLDGGGEIAQSSCQRSAEMLLCVEAGATSPPQLVAIDLGSGERRVLYDPNPILRKVIYPHTEKISWTFADGRTEDGLLVYPGDTPAAATTRLPLVITTYDCRGVLRGGVAQIAPEFILAERGIASLCVNTDWSNLTREPLTSGDDLLKIHKVMIASYAAAIDLLAKRGTVDPARVGIAGQSLSSVVAGYAISHTRLFAAAVTGTGVTIDPATLYLTAPTADSWRRTVFSTLGLPDDGRDPTGSWAEVSPALNAPRIVAPLLLQPPEDEYLLGLQLFSAIQRAGGVAEAYIFPNGGHMLGREPAQQYARQLRSVDWLAFWLGGMAGSDPISVADYQAWQKWRPVEAAVRARAP